MIGRRGLVTGLSALLTTGGSVAAYAGVVEPFFRLEVQRHRIQPDGWPPGLRLRIAILSDLHAGAPMMDEARIEQIVERTNALAPDIVLLPGDFGPSLRLVRRVIPHAEVARRLAALRAPLGLYAVNGNHDWWEDEEALRRGRGAVTAMARALEAVGIPTLRNQVMRAGPVLVGGLDSQIAFRRAGGAEDIPRLFGQVTGEDPLLLMAHEPDIFPRLPARATITVSGHTHGGQVRLGGWSPVTPSRYGNRYAWGHVRENGRDLVVSGGLGVSTMPVRLGVPPEITLIEAGAA